MAKYLLNKILIFVSLLILTSAINLESVQEGACIVPPVDQSFDLLWLANYAEWYFPVWHKYELYKWSTAISGYNIKNVTEDMAARSCMILYIGGDAGATQTAFGNKKTTFDSSIADHGIFDWTETRSDGTPGYRGRTYITHTDNDKYYVSVSCWEKENQRSYTVHSNIKTLDEESKSKIRTHLLSLGFDVTNNWLEMQYDDCIDLEHPERRKISMAAPSATQRTTVNANIPPQAPSNTNVNRNTPSRNPTSIELFFSIFRTAIDFLQNVSQNTYRVLVRFVTRLLGRLGLGSLL